MFPYSRSPIGIRFSVSALLSALTLGAVAWVPGSASAEASNSTSTVTNTQDTSPRERLLMDFGWRFEFGHPADPAKDFTHATSYFSYFAKAGYGDGAAAVKFDDSAWRLLDLPHDWAVEAPFSGNGSYSHGFKAIGRKFPERSVGWYRKKFTVPASDLGRRITVEFDGVFRDAVVFINGFYLGRHPSGNQGFQHNLSDYLNYGGENVIAVRVDATMEEGWYYEGAGIYRHVWLGKTSPLHVARHGTSITTEVGPDATRINVVSTLHNAGLNATPFELEQTVVDAAGKTVAREIRNGNSLPPGDTADFTFALAANQPRLWSLEDPYLHRVITTLRAGGTVVDRIVTSFGFRTVRFDPNEGFFLNERRVFLCGTNNHQDHAGVGAAIPDALHDFRIRQLQAIGVNAYRASHNPPTPELLDACDRLGMLVIDETRLMGTAPEQLGAVEEMIRRDRNHPSVILWSLGNEEWALEGNITGARVATTMQAFARRLDPTRRQTVAISGGWGGISRVIDVMGVNYIKHGSTDRQHADFPNQPILGTEETTLSQTRGIYADDKDKAHLGLSLTNKYAVEMFAGWKHYNTRPYLAGLFFWTGFDYRGEPTPFGYPAIASQFGLLDLCGFPKDSAFYIKAWSVAEPVLHLFPHWNWPGKEGVEILVGVFSNHEEVELRLNGRSLGRKPLARNEHLDWQVPYEPGALEALGYRAGKVVETRRIETTSAPAALVLTPDRTVLKADGEDVAVFTVSVLDSAGRPVPTAADRIAFTVTGGQIIGVGNGDPGSLEPDRASERKLFNGLAQVIVQTTKTPGELRLSASADGLQPATATLAAEAVTLRPSVP